MESDDFMYDILEFDEQGNLIEINHQRVDNSDDTSEVIAAADEYFSIQQEGC